MRFRKGTRAPTLSAGADAPASAGPIDPHHLDSAALRCLIQGAIDWLDRNAADVNQLNVFPVPDGDTGTNMLLTMRAALDGAAKAKSDDTGAVMRAIAQGAVMGARGNSGVILSQIVAGLARGMEGTTTVDGAALARSLMEGATTAYRAVTRPVEGTILTVAREAGEGAMKALETHAAPSCDAVLDAALISADQAVERTPEQLPILRQAGVVDAGGEGYRIILEGMALTLRGEPLPERAAHATHLVAPPIVEHRVTVDTSAIPSEEWGYCTQFVIRGEALDLERIRDELQEQAASTLVVGYEDAVRVHGHTEDPGQLLSYAVKFGRLQRISIEDMDAQHDEWLKAQVSDVSVISPSDSGEPADQDVAPAPEIAVVAVSPGAGLTQVFESLGAAEVISGGQTMNPSANDVLEAARRTRARAVLVLPNNGNVVMTAQQAARVAEEEGLRLLVVPTKTVPQGIAALLTFNPPAGADQNAEEMAAAATQVRTVEITRATRSVTLDGVDVKAGDILGVVDDKVVTAGPDRLDVTRSALDAAGAARAEIVTFYRGAEAPEAAAQELVKAMQHAFPKVTIELVTGGQPHYDYIISVE